MVKRVLIAFDFDHTLIDENSDTYVLDLLPDGGHLPQSIAKLYSIHGWNDYQREVFRYLHAKSVSKDQLLARVAEMPLVEGMHELLKYLSLSKALTSNGMVKNGLVVKHAVSEVKQRAAVNGVGGTAVVENGSYPAQDQHTLIDGNAVALESAVNGSVPDDHMPSLVSGPSAPQVQFEVIIISDANLAVIDHILETAGLKSVFSKVYTNPSSFDSAGCLQLSPYHRQDWCSRSPANMCKGHILDEHCKQTGINYDVIVYVGDGANDFCPTLRLRPSDVVFPRRRFTLAKHIAEGRNKVAARVRSWDTGFDIIDGLKEIVMSDK